MNIFILACDLYQNCRENLQEVNDQQEGSELDFYAFYENEVLDANYQNCK